MYIKTTLLASALACCALSAPLPVAQTDSLNGVITPVTAATIEAIAESTNTCVGAPFPNECADSTRAAVALNQAFDKYQVTTTGEQAALVAYMLYESGSFKYSVNHFPGRPGQGTRMMAMPKFVRSYAVDLVGLPAVQQAEAPGGNEALNAVLAIANEDDERSFGMAAWFLKTVCDETIRDGLATQSVDGWHDFMTKCVETEIADRDGLWVSAKQAMLGDDYKPAP